MKRDPSYIIIAIIVGCSGLVGSMYRFYETELDSRQADITVLRAIVHHHEETILKQRERVQRCLALAGFWHERAEGEGYDVRAAAAIAEEEAYEVSGRATCVTAPDGPGDGESNGDPDSPFEKGGEAACP